MLSFRLFQANEYPLEFYNGKAILNIALHFFTTDCDGNDLDFDFPDYVSSYMRVYNERSGRLLVNLDLTRSGGYLIVNASADDMTFDDNGNYYYEVGYVVTGGYEQALRFGVFRVI